MSDSSPTHELQHSRLPCPWLYITIYTHTHTHTHTHTYVMCIYMYLYRASQVVLVVKNLPANAGGEGNGNPLHYSCLENPMDRGAWKAVVYRVKENQRWLKQISTHTNARDLRDVSLIPGSGRSPGGGNGNPLQYSCLENPMDGKA